MLPQDAPNIIYMLPQKYSTIDMGTPIEVEVLNDLIQYHCSDPEVSEYIPFNVFQSLDTLYEAIGKPVRKLENAWNIFLQLKEISRIE